jgi:hypothetical protein
MEPILDDMKVEWFHVTIPLPVILFGVVVCVGFTLFMVFRSHRRRTSSPAPPPIKRP